MSRRQAVLLVAGRELREALRRKSFWVVAGLLLLGSSAGMIVPELIDDGNDRYDVVLVDGNPGLESALRAAGDVQDVDLEIESVADEAGAERAVEDDEADVAAVAGPHPVVIVKGDGGDVIVGLVGQAVAVDALASRLADAGLSDAEIEAALTEQSPDIRRLEAGESDRRAAASIISIGLYLLLFMLMMAVATGTAIEKSNRISEVLVAIVRPGHLLFGKVLGIAVTGVLTVLAATLPVLVKVGVGGDLPRGTGGAIVAGMVWSLLGMALYLTIAAALGALVERQEEAGSVVTPLSLLLVAAYVVSISDPEGALAAVLAYVPLTSPLIMPSRIALGVSSPVEVAGSLLLGSASVLAVGRLAAVVYRRAIVRTGRRLGLRDVLRPA